MVVCTLFAVGALLGQAGSLTALRDTVEDVIWLWLLLAVVAAFANKAGYALALMGSVVRRLRLARSVEVLFAAAFSNLVVPGIGSTAVQVRYLQREGVDLASAVAAGAVLANVANVVVQGALFLVALLLTSQSVDTDLIDIGDVAQILALAVFAAGVVVAVVTGVERFRRRVIPAAKQGIATVRTALHSRRQILLLTGGNLFAALMSALCLYSSLRAYGGHVGFWSLLVVNILVGTVASLVPVPGGNTLVAAVGLSTAFIALGVPDSVAAAAVLTQQLLAGYLPALPGWFATRHLLRRGYL